MRAFCLLGFLVLVSGAIAGSVAAEPSAQEILDKMKATYASASSYTDSGVVAVEHVTGGRTWNDRRPFATAFVRGGGFRFEHWEPEDPVAAGLMGEPGEPLEHYVVWSDGVNVQSWWSRRPVVERYTTVERALGGPTGVSYGAATRVPGLLMPEMHWGSLLENLTHARLVGEETIDGNVCHKLTATIPSSGKSRTLWVDRELHLIRRVEWELPSGPAWATIKPSLNAEVPPETFAFDPDS